jgi:hypothetical protein
MVNGEWSGNWELGFREWAFGVRSGLPSAGGQAAPFTHLSHGFVSTGNNFGIFGTKYEESKIIQGYTNLRR